MKKKLKILILAFISLAVLFAVCAACLYFLMLSPYFCRKVFLPLAGKFSGTEIKADDVALSPAKSNLRLKGLSVSCNGRKLLDAGEIDISWGLRNLLEKNIDIENLFAGNINIYIYMGKDGKSNIPGGTEAKPEKNVAAKSGGLNGFTFRNIKVENLNLVFEKEGVSKVEIRDFNISAPELKNGEEAKIEFKGTVKASAGKEINIASASLENKTLLVLDRNFFPEKITSATVINRISGNIDRYTMDGQSFTIAVRALKNNEKLKLEQLSVKELAGQEAISEINAAGDISQGFSGFELDINVKRLSPQFIELVQGFAGGKCHFSKAQVRYNGHLSMNGNLFAARGEINCAGISVSRAGRQTTNPFDLNFSHDLSIDAGKKEINLKTVNAEILENKHKVLELTLSSPSFFSWAETDGGKQAGFAPKVHLKFSELDLRAANLFLPSDNSAQIAGGKLNGLIEVQYKASENSIDLRVDTQISKLNAETPYFTGADIAVSQKGGIEIKNFSDICCKGLEIEIKKAGKPCALAKADCSFKIAALAGNAAFDISSLNEETMTILPEHLKNNRQLKETAGKLAPFNLSVKGKTSFDLIKKYMDVDEFALEIKSRGEKAFGINLEEKSRLLFGKSDWIEKTLKARVSAENLDMAIANSFMPEKANTVFSSGRLTANILTTLKYSQRDMNYSGTLHLMGCNMRSGENIFKSTDIRNRFNIDLKDYTKMKIISIDTEAGQAGKKAISVSGSSEFDFAGSSAHIKMKLNSMNAHILGLVPCENIRNSISLKSIDMTGGAELNYNLQKSEISFNASMDISNLMNDKLPQPLKSSINVDMAKSGERLEVRKFSCGLADSAGKLAELLFKADILLPPAKGKSTFYLGSEKINISAIESFFAKKTAAPPAARKKDIAASPPVPAKPGESSESFPFKDMDLEAQIDLKNISYGSELHGECSSLLSIKKGIFKADPFRMTLNGAPINCKAEIDMSAKENYPFDFKADFKSVQLPPLFKELVKGAYGTTRGSVENFSASFTGKGFSSAALEKDFTGSLNADFKDLSIPNQMRQNQYVALLFMSIEVFAQVQKSIPTLKSSQQLSDCLSFTKGISENTKNLDFSSGELRLKAEKGKVDIGKCLFQGPFIKKMELSGDIGFNKDLKLASETNMNGLMLPLKIDGTLDKPEPNIKAFVAGFIEKNALNILKPENIGNIIEGNFEKILEGTGKILKNRR